MLRCFSLNSTLLQEFCSIRLSLLCVVEEEEEEEEEEEAFMPVSYSRVTLG